MIKQNIFIINYISLYEILEEIKENLSFRVIKYEHVEEFIKSDPLDIKNSLIVLRPNQKILLNKNFNEKNLFYIKNSPVSLNKLVELINIQLIKLRFNHKSKISIKSYDF